jgi:signal transduction histidine kinase
MGTRAHAPRPTLKLPPMAKSARVLIVDDHRELVENLLELLRGYIDQFDVECVATTSAEEALLAASAQEFELALLDLHLPDGSGLELLAQLKEKHPLLQVVIITGDATVESAIKALEQGAFGYVLKPFRAQSLVETASQAIERAKLLAERESLRSELERSERQHRDIIDRVPAFVVALDEAGEIVVWNRQLETVTGFSPGEMLGQDGTELIAADGTRRLALKGGGHRSVRWKQAVVRQTSGPALTYAVGVDVTEESEMLRRAMRAERLAAVGTLAAGLAHEVRNPLNSATLQLQLLERRIEKGRLEPAATSQVITTVKSEIERLERLVDDFLAFARPTPTALEPTDLADLVGSVLELITMEARDASIDVQCDISEAIGPVPLDPQRIRQVLLNLIKNAIEAMAGCGGGTLTLRAHPAKTEASVMLEVEDTGPGFDAAHAPVFDAFYTTKDRGTGLGLAIVHRIVGEHGGTIEVSSAPGRTCFVVTLPQPQSHSARKPKA